MADLNPEDFTPDQLQALFAAPGAPALPTVTPTTEHDADTGHSTAPPAAVEPDPDETQVIPPGDAPAPEGDEQQQDSQPGESASDEYDRVPLEEEVRRFKAGDKRIRLTNLDDDGVAAILVAKRNPDGPKTVLDALVQVRGREAVLKDLGVDPGAPAPVAGEAPAPPVDPVVAMQSEIAALKQKARELADAFETEEAAKVQDEIDAKRDALTELKIQTALAKATPVAPQISDADFQRLYNADLAATIAQYPDMARPDSPLLRGMEAEQAKLAAQGDDIVYAWNLNSVIAAKVAADLNLQPRRASSPAAGHQPPRPAPGPVHGSRSGAAPVKVDVAALQRGIMPYQLAAYLNGDDS